MTDPLHDDERDDREEKGILPDGIRRALVSGLSAVFVTEEGIRNALGDMRLPKDAISYLVSQTERSRRELFRVVSDELKGFLKNIDLTGELKNALTGLKVHVEAEFSFVDADAPKAEVKASIVGADDDDAPRSRAKRKSKKKKKKKKS